MSYFPPRRLDSILPSNITPESVVKINLSPLAHMFVTLKSAASVSKLAICSPVFAS